MNRFHLLPLSCELNSRERIPTIAAKSRDAANGGSMVYGWFAADA
jgi:hypothetical protein